MATVLLGVGVVVDVDVGVVGVGVVVVVLGEDGMEFATPVAVAVDAL